MTVDVRKRESIKQAAFEINDKYDGIDILINSAGVLKWKYLIETDDQEIDDTIDTNLKAHIWVRHGLCLETSTF